MRTETAYEVYSFGDHRWMMEARFAAEAKNDAYLLANELRRQPGIETVRIVREIWDPRTNGFSEVTIYEVRGPGRERAGGARRPVFGALRGPVESRASSAAAGAPQQSDPSLRILGRVLMVAIIALLAAAAATMTAQSVWTLGNDGKVGLFAAVLIGVLVIGLMTSVSRDDWRNLIADAPVAPPAQRTGGASPARRGSPPPIQPGQVNEADSTSLQDVEAEKPAADDPPPDRHVRAELRLLDFLQHSLADPRLGPEERSSFQAFVFTIGAVDALAREDGLERPARLSLLETCGVALGIDAATVSHTLDNLARTVSRSDGLALAQAGMRAMLDRLAGLPFANGLADALAFQQAQQAQHGSQIRPDADAGKITLAIGLLGLDQPTMQDTRKRITDMVDYHRGFGMTFRPDAATACFGRHTEALIAALALAAVIQPIGGTRGRPRFGLGDNLAGAAAAMAAAEPGEIVADAAFDSAIRVGLGEDLPPGYRRIGTVPAEKPAVEAHAIRTAG